jgi:polysaccharide deacetylase family protein (PEP-CTERM system associated)
MTRNALSVDVEDYFHVSAFSRNISRSDWDGIPLRVDNNTRRLLALFDEFDTRATFFVLGWVAERLPDLIRDIAARGHEIASHGYSHQLVYNQSPDEFRAETLRSKRLLEDIVRQPVCGYRAASYSITARSQWALDTLVEAGFDYDSSIFPIHHDRYGMPGTPDHPYVLQTPNGKSLVEFPLSTARVLGYRLPVSGGGYFRIYPYALTRSGLAQVNRRQQPFIFYLHPWEIDPAQPRVSASRLSRFRHYHNLDKCESRLRRLLKDFRFGTVREVLQDLGLSARPGA